MAKNVKANSRGNVRHARILLVELHMSTQHLTIPSLLLLMKTEML